MRNRHYLSWCGGFVKSAAGAAALLLLATGPARAAYEMYIFPDPDDGSLGTIVAPTNVYDQASAMANLPVIVTSPFIYIEAADFFPNSKFLRWEKDPTSGGTIDNPNAKRAKFTYSGPGATNQVFITAKFQIGVRVESTNMTGTIGSPNPTAGWHYYDENALETFMVTSPHPDAADPLNVRSVVKGWTGTGSIPPVGVGFTTPQLAITNTSTIKWQWEDQYKLTVNVVGTGAVNRLPDLPWYTNGQVVTLQAVEIGGSFFIGWSDGTLTYSNQVIMTGAKTITANFSSIQQDGDKDGLPDVWETRFGLDKDPLTGGLGASGAFGDPDNDGVPNITEYMISWVMITNGMAQVECSPIHADSDGDGMHDGYEYFHIGSPSNASPGNANNALAAVNTNGVNGRSGNLDQDFKWNPTTGYKTPVGLMNIEEYVGPDGIVPGVWTAAVAVAGISKPVNRYQSNPDDTGDQSFSDTVDSEIAGGLIIGDGFDDGYEYTWDEWQAVHGGDPVGDPMGHYIPYRAQNEAWPMSVVIADLAGRNGTNDLAIANSGHDSVSVLYGLGNGTFNPPAPADEWAVGSTPVCIVAGNFDGPAINDLATANLGTNTISVLLRAGTTYNVTNYVASWGPSCIATGRFSANATLDLAVACTNGDLVIFEGNGAGGFAVSQTLNLGAGKPVYVTAAPINGAARPGPGYVGRMDLAVCLESGDTMTILTNNGAGVFSIATSLATGPNPKAVILKDMDEDGTNDICWVEYGANNNACRSMHGNGNSTFATPWYTKPLATGSGSRHLAGGQFDDLYPAPNADLDVVVPNEFLNTVSVLLGAAGDASLTSGTTLDVGRAPTWVAVGKLNDDDGNGTINQNDGDDFVVVNRDQDSVYVYLSNRDGSFTRSANLDVSARIADRRYNPGAIHALPPDSGRPDYDVRYNPLNGASSKWLTDEDEYNAWQLPFAGTTNGSILRVENPTIPRSSHPFLWDADRDRMPDGWEMAFSYNPWAGDTDLNGIRDDAENPDYDWFARDAVLPGVKHHEVYLLRGYNPYTGFGYRQNYEAGGANTARFTNYEEIIGSRGMPAITEDDPNDTATHPFMLDTDGDGIWDGWEFYVDLDPQDPADAALDQPYDNDGLSNLEEFQSWATSTNIMAARTTLANWQNKLQPTDIWDGDTDWDQVGDAGERAAFNITLGAGTAMATLDPDTGAVTYNWYIGGGLNPTTADTDGDRMPDAWESYFPGVGVVTQDVATGLFRVASWAGGMDGTVNDMYGDYDGDGLMNYQEYFAGAVYNWQFWHTGGSVAWTSNRGVYGYEPWDFFNQNMSAGGQWFVGPGGRRPYQWDPNYWYHLPSLKEWHFMTMCQAPICPLRWTTTDPGDRDSDLDGMDDYWEAFHGLDPLFGILDCVATKVLHIPTPTWTILPHFVWQNSRDIRNYPWIAGHPEMDPDQDELQNWEEALNATTYTGPTQTQPPHYHSDPSPQWITDTSYSESWVNLYYWLGTTFGYHGGPFCFPGMNWWYWDGAVRINVDAAPSYGFTFECNEGFDTDNDMLSDKAELYDQAVGPGATDVLESQSPIKRRAMFFNGNAATRTRVPHAHGFTQLRQFTAELWARPTQPAGNQEQVMVEKGAYVDQGNIMNFPASLRLNFKIGLDTTGRPFGGYHGAERDVQFVEVKADPQGVFTSNEWYHTALVYDGDYQADGHFVGVLRLYVDGELAGARASSLIPFNGWVGLSQTGTVNTGYYYPMPVVMGAGDNNPGGAVDGASDIGIFFPVGPLRCASLSAPALHSYYRGWLDQLLVWDGGRTRAELRSTMRARWRRSDLFLAKTTQFPSLIMAYTFDDTQDPDHGVTAPYGFGGLNMRPIGMSGTYWWGLANDRSLVYTDYHYVPWLENQAVHNPFDPPWDSTRSSGGGTAYPNTANPYGFFYEHATRFTNERYPRASAGSFVDDFANHLADMLPLRWAVADEDVVMWDNGTKGTAAFDTDGDGLPDGWEEKYGFDPLSPLETGLDPDNDGISNLYEYYIGTSPISQNSDGDDLDDAEEDTDGDKLANLSEFALNTMPNMKDTDDDGLSDYEEVTGSTDPAFAATRPATSSNPEGTTDPLSSLSPPIQRSMYFNGFARLIVPPSNKLMAPSWTVETWVKPATNNANCVLVCRYVKGTVPGAFGINYEIGLTSVSATTNRPYARYRSMDGTEVRVDGTQPTETTSGLAPLLIPKNAWSHIAATYDQATLTLSLYVNGKLASYRTDATAVPATVNGYKTDHWGDEITVGAYRSDVAISQGFRGWMDEVRIWRGARQADEIFDRYNAPEGVPGSQIGAIRYGREAMTAVAGISSAVTSLPPTQQVHMLVQAEPGTEDATFAAVRQAGGTIASWLSPNTRIVLMTPAQLNGVKDVVRSAGLVPAQAKIANKLYCDGSHSSRPVLAQFYDDVTSAAAASAVTAAGGTVRGSGYVAGNFMMIDASDEQVRNLAANDKVLMVMPPPQDLVAGRTMRLCNRAAAIGGVKAMPYSVVGDGWDGPGLGSANLTYHFLNTTPDLPAAACEKAMTDQLRKWADYAALYFSQSATAGLTNSFDMGFGIDPAGIFDGPLGILAYGYFPNDINPEPIAGDSYYDEGETWTIAGSGIDIRFVSLHEFGHCLGLGHSTDPTAVMFPFYSGSGADPVLQQDDIDGIQSIYASAVGSGRAEFRFDDGGTKAEDFSGTYDWLENWRSAAVLDGAVFALDAPPLDRDTDGDGMPDWWEIGNGIDPYDATGDNGAYGDPDRDELDNIYEYYAGTAPMIPDSDRNGFSDYDSGLDGAGSGRTHGERYDDGDRIPDIWELLYLDPAPNTGRRGLDPALYDAHLDPDDDGWSSYAEYMGSYVSDPATGARTRSSMPTFETNYPMPFVTFRVQYNGLLGGTIQQALGVNGQVVLNIYKTKYMDGNPVATMVMTAPQLATGSLTVDTMTTGHLVEGTNYVFAFLDVNADNLWDMTNEPAGVASPQPMIGWDGPTVADIGITDREQKSGYPRYSWPTVPGVEGYHVRLARTSAPVDTNIVTRFIAGQARNYFHEGDYLAAGKFGVLGSGTSGSTYVLYVSYEANIEGHKVIMPHPTTPAPFRLVDAVTLTTPVMVTPNDTVFHYANNEIEWSMVRGATSYRIEIARTNNGPALVSMTAPAPYRTPAGTYRAELPFFAGDRYDGVNSFTNARYSIRLRAEIPGVTPSSYVQQAFNLNLRKPQDGGKSMISGDVYYFGKVARGYGAGLTNDLRIVVQTFTSGGFSGKPDAQVEFSYVCNTNAPAAKKGTYNLLGLHGGVHHVRAFLDLNGNKDLDLFEPFGFAQVFEGTFDYAPRVVDLGSSGNVVVENVRVVIRDRDTDDDGLPDGWEYTALGGTLAYGAHDDPDGDLADNLAEYEDTWVDSDPMNKDTDGDGVMDGDELRMGLLTHVADTDGDGLSDGIELAIGLNPLDPKADKDGDTMTDAVEVLRAHTNPNDARDVLGVVRMDPALNNENAVFTMTWDGKAGVQYKVEMSYDMNVWLDVPGAEFTGSGKPLEFTAAPFGDMRTRYFRVVIP